MVNHLKRETKGTNEKRGSVQQSCLPSDNRKSRKNSCFSNSLKVKQTSMEFSLNDLSHQTKVAYAIIQILNTTGVLFLAELRALRIRIDGRNHGFIAMTSSYVLTYVQSSIYANVTSIMLVYSIHFLILDIH